MAAQASSGRVSRGPGRWQRALLAALDRRDPVLVADAVEDELGRVPTRAEMVAGRRAAHSLDLFGRNVAHVTRVWTRDAGGRPQPHLALTRDAARIRRDLIAWALSDAS